MASFPSETWCEVHIWNKSQQDLNIIEQALIKADILYHWAKKNLKAIGKGDDYFRGKELSADANYHSNSNLQKSEEENIDAYIPDTGFRKRDER